MQEKNRQLNKKRIIHRGCDTTEINLGGCEPMTLNLSEHAYRRAFERLGLDKSGVKMEMRRLLENSQMAEFLFQEVESEILLYCEQSENLLDGAVMVLIPALHDITLKTIINRREDGFILRNTNICFFFIKNKLEQVSIDTFVKKVGYMRIG